MPPEQTSTFRGWNLAPVDRMRLLARFPPAYANIVADHVTFPGSQGVTMPAIRSARVIGRTDDGNGVQALVVELNGTTNRPDGSTYHMTWSLGPGRKAQESNDVLRSHGWQRVDGIRVTLLPIGA